MKTSTPIADPAGDYAWAIFDRIEALRPGAGAVLKDKAEASMSVHAEGAGPGQNPMAALFAAKQIDMAITYCSGVASPGEGCPRARQPAGTARARSASGVRTGGPLRPSAGAAPRPVSAVGKGTGDHRARRTRAAQRAAATRRDERRQSPGGGRLERLRQDAPAHEADSAASRARDCGSRRSSTPTMPSTSISRARTRTSTVRPGASEVIVSSARRWVQMHEVGAEPEATLPAAAAPGLAL